MRGLPVLLAVVVGCTPAAYDVPLDPDADRHFGTGDVYRVPDDACSGSVTAGEGTTTIGVVNDYLETPVVAVTVAADCSVVDQVEVLPGEAGFVSVPVPKVVRIETLDGEILSAWAVFYPLGEGAIVVQP